MAKPKKNKFICNCHGVTQKQITEAVNRRGATSFLELQNLTRAATGCKRCGPMAEAIFYTELRKIASNPIQLRLDFDRGGEG